MQKDHVHIWRAAEFQLFSANKQHTCFPFGNLGLGTSYTLTTVNIYYTLFGNRLIRSHFMHTDRFSIAKKEPRRFERKWVRKETNPYWSQIRTLSYMLIVQCWNVRESEYLRLQKIPLQSTLLTILRRHLVWKNRLEGQGWLRNHFLNFAKNPELKLETKGAPRPIFLQTRIDEPFKEDNCRKVIRLRANTVISSCVCNYRNAADSLCHRHRTAQWKNKIFGL